jgi:transcriptional regulator with XRE-family HTH domain
MNNKFSENLKKIRKEHNLSQEELADELGVSRQAISKWESSTAYPEMDKIIALCDKFDLNIDDLLHRDIKEVKGEEESKKKINNYIDDFLKFITDSINMFSRMNFKSKIKCIIEQLIIIGLLIAISFIAGAIFSSIIGKIIHIILPMKIAIHLTDILSSLFGVFCTVASIIIVIHVFKTRYLDYYNSVIDDTKEEENNEKEPTEKKEKVSFKKNDNKIVIRDPKHSEYGFINGVLKLIVYVIKFFAALIALPVAGFLVFLFSMFIISFSIIKTGLFFIGILTTVLSSGVITIIILLLLINFIFNRRNDKKKMIWSFILSLVLLGMGIGLIFFGSTNFTILNDNENMLEIKTKTYKMSDSFAIHNNYTDINYIEADNNDVKVEYMINKLCVIEENISTDGSIYPYVECDDPFKLTKEFTKNVNNKKIVPLSSQIYEINVYTTKSNIAKIKANVETFEAEQEAYAEKRNNWEKTIDELTEENAKLRAKLSELED